MNEAYPKGVRVNGTLRCPTCDSVLRPKHWKKNCCKSAYRQYMHENYPKSGHDGNGKPMKLKPS